MDNLPVFKMLVIKRLYNLSHDQAEFWINDRISFRRFLGLDFGDTVLDANTIWLYKDMLSRNEAGKELFDLFDEVIAANGHMTRTGSIVDVFFVGAPSGTTRRSSVSYSNGAKSLRNGQMRRARRNWRNGIRKPRGRREGTKCISV